MLQIMNNLINTLGWIGIFAIAILLYLYYDKLNKNKTAKISMLSYILYDIHPIKDLVLNHYQNHKVLYYLLRILSRQEYMGVADHNMFYLQFAGFLKKARNELKKSIGTGDGKKLIQDYISHYIDMRQPSLNEQKLLANKIEKNKLLYESVVKDILRENINPDEATFIKLFSAKLNLSLEEASQCISELKELYTGLIFVSNNIIYMKGYEREREINKKIQELLYEISFLQSIDLDNI